MRATISPGCCVETGTRASDSSRTATNRTRISDSFFTNHGGTKTRSQKLVVLRASASPWFVYGVRISRMPKVATSLLIVVALSAAVSSQQAPPADRPAFPATLRQIIPGHYVYAANNEGRLFNSGVVVTSDGVLVFDALETEA